MNQDDKNIIDNIQNLIRTYQNLISDTTDLKEKEYYQKKILNLYELLSQTIEDHMNIIDKEKNS